MPVSEGMREVVETLVIAILLVILVVYLFLQTGGHTDSYAGSPFRSSARLSCSAIRLLKSTHFDVGPRPGNRSGG